MVETQHSKEPLHVNDISGKQQLTFAVNRHHPLYKAETKLFRTSESRKVKTLRRPVMLKQMLSEKEDVVALRLRGPF